MWLGVKMDTSLMEKLENREKGRSETNDQKSASEDEKSGSRGERDER